MGEVRFVSNLSDGKQELMERGFLVVTVKRAPRGKLADSIDDASRNITSAIGRFAINRIAIAGRFVDRRVGARCCIAAAGRPTAP